MAGIRTDIFWCKVFFKAFIKHFRKMTDEEIVRDIRQSMDDLEDLVEDTDTFGSQMVRWANERADDPFATAARENGKKGGRPRKIVKDESEQRVGGNSGQGLVTAPAAPGHKATAPSTRIAPAEPEVFNFAYRGEFGNVRLTQDQYNSLLMKFGNKVACDRAIDSLSAKLENGEKNPRSHYAELVKWANYRVDKAEEAENSATHYETVSEHNRRVLENGRKWIDEHFPPKKEAANG